MVKHKDQKTRGQNHPDPKSNEKWWKKTAAFLREWDATLNYVFTEHWFLSYLCGTFLLLLVGWLLLKLGPRASAIGVVVLGCVIVITAIRVHLKRKRVTGNMIPASKVVEACNNIITAIRKSSGQAPPTFEENDKLAAELFLKSFVAEYQAQTMAATKIIFDAITKGIEGEIPEFGDERHAKMSDWESQLREFAADMACTGPLFMLTMPEGKERAEKMIELLTVLLCQALIAGER